MTSRSLSLHLGKSNKTSHCAFSSFLIFQLAGFCCSQASVFLPLVPVIVPTPCHAARQLAAPLPSLRTWNLYKSPPKPFIYFSCANFRLSGVGLQPCAWNQQLWRRGIKQLVGWWNDEGVYRWYFSVCAYLFTIWRRFLTFYRLRWAMHVYA